MIILQMYQWLICKSVNDYFTNVSMINLQIYQWLFYKSINDYFTNLSMIILQITNTRYCRLTVWP